MATNLKVSPGIDGIPAGQINDTWSSGWFMQFLRTWLRAADVRNAKGVGITITGSGTTPATLSLTGAVTGTVVIPMAKLTGGGTAGSMTFVNGVLTTVTQAT